MQTATAFLNSTTLISWRGSTFKMCGSLPTWWLRQLNWRLAVSW
jgi:hypothetical protein